MTTTLTVGLLLAILLNVTITTAYAFHAFTLLKSLRDTLVPWMVTIHQIEGQIMAEVQVDQTVLDNAAAAIESLVTAVSNFLASPQVQQLPQADVSALTQAVSDAGNAQTELQNAAPPAPAPSS